MNTLIQILPFLDVLLPLSKIGVLFCKRVLERTSSFLLKNTNYLAQNFSFSILNRKYLLAIHVIAAVYSFSSCTKSIESFDLSCNKSIIHADTCLIWVSHKHHCRIDKMSDEVFPDSSRYRITVWDLSLDKPYEAPAIIDYGYVEYTYASGKYYTYTYIFNQSGIYIDNQFCGNDYPYYPGNMLINREFIEAKNIVELFNMNAQ